jgi:prepilin peptidase CpaA
MLATLAALAGSAVLIAAALYDLGWRLIPNMLPLALAGAGLVLRLGEGGQAIVSAVLVAACATLLLAGFWWYGLIGGGDAKLAAAASLYVPPGAIAPFVLATALAGGVLALVFLAARPLLPARIAPASRGAPMLRRLARAEAWRMRRGILPYAVAIAAGALIARSEGTVSWG